jgi:hypothetical protein
VLFQAANRVAAVFVLRRSAALVLGVDFKFLVVLASQLHADKKT